MLTWFCRAESLVNLVKPIKVIVPGRHHVPHPNLQSLGGSEAWGTRGLASFSPRLLSRKSSLGENFTSVSNEKELAGVRGTNTIASHVYELRKGTSTTQFGCFIDPFDHAFSLQ